mmetsp:Transcript_11089/g.30002  ORF Transcript_11089/g.30002 Transcript_11089/m.30002 type:complete len:229 (-) Transcript_11089:2114-2800(-)
MPPPAIIAHATASLEELGAELVEVRLLPVEGKVEAASAHPAELYPLVAEVVLEHPVVAAGVGEDHGPHRGVGGNTQGQLLILECLVRVDDPGGDARVHLVVALGGSGRVEPPEELGHGGHHHGVGGEGADDIGHAERRGGVRAGHEVRWATHRANRKAATECLAVAHEISLDTEVLLSPSRCEAEARVHLVEDEDHARLGTHGLELLEPLGVGGGLAGLARVGHEGEV